MPQNFYELVWIFIIYAFIGWCTEVSYAALDRGIFVNRGFLNGPYCPIYGCGVLIVVVLLTPLKKNLLILYLGSFLLTSILEFITGFVMEKVFHNKWWDYSDMPLNIGGYVCLLFSIVWGFACLFIIYFIQPLIHDVLAFIPTIVGIILIVILGIILIADLYVTASTIFKFNRRLAAMEKIAAEMHEISDQIGQEIFEKTIRALDARERSQEISEELRSRIASLHARYHESTDKPERISRRLMNAFPKMESRQYKESLEVLKKRWKR